MRPLKLELEGFTAFRNRTCLDFTDLDLFAVTGPTGAGKSSLIDAMCYALYGRVPRVAAEVGASISQNLERMQVSLEFQANGRTYRVLRETRRKGAGNTRLEQLGAEDWQPLADRAREVTQKIEEIVGLDFEAFIRSVILPQGQFQEFLAGSPERRREVLDRLLRVDVYKRMQAKAGQQAQSLQQSHDEIERRLRDELADATPETLALRRAELAQTDGELAIQAGRVAGLQQALDLARQLATARQELSVLQVAQEQAESRLKAAGTQVEGGDARIEALRTSVEALQQQLAANTYDDVLFATLTGAANLALNIERVKKAAGEIEGRLAAADQRATTSAREVEARSEAQTQAQAAVAEAEAILSEARRHDLAAVLKAGLKKGDVCPICGGTVGELPIVETEGLAAAERALQQAKAASDAAQAALSAASTTHAVAQTELQGLRIQLAQKRDELTQAVAELAATLSDQTDRSLTSVQACLQAQRTARDECQRLQEDESSLNRALVAEEAALREAREQASALAAEAKAAATASHLARQKHDAARAGLLPMLRAQQLSEPASDLEAGHDPLPRIESALRSASESQSQTQTHKGELQAQVRRLEQDIEKAEALRGSQIEVDQELNVTADLALMLRADRFQAFVQAQALRSLAEDGSRRLMELSAGRYELEVSTGGQDFLVRDKWNDGDLRSVRTLSGGETFLASLALALALAETLPGLAPGKRLALESIFLDEGFGSLDAEALDRAAEALDALRGENRMVCIVTHLPELAQRLPARIVVAKSESGSTVSIA